MIRKLGKLAALAGATEAARRYVKNNPDKINKFAGQAGRFVNQRTRGKYHSQIDGALRRVQDATRRSH